MRSMLLLTTATMLLAGCAGIPFLDDEAPSPAPPPTAASTAPSAEPKLYEIRAADRGLVRRVKVLMNGRTIDTVTLSRARTEASSYCCDDDGCKELESHGACTTFKMTCDVEGACTRENAAPAKRL